MASTAQALASGDGNEVTTGIPVADFKPAAEFYERLLGRAPDFVAIEGCEVLWQVRDLAWIYVLLDQERAGSALMARRVDDLDTTRAQLAARGIGAASLCPKGGRKGTPSATRSATRTIALAGPLCPRAPEPRSRRPSRTRRAERAERDHRLQAPSARTQPVASA
jgi:hypothetical protein